MNDEPKRSGRLMRLLAASCLVLGCGAKASDALHSTNTGNPPVIDQGQIRVVKTAGGVEVRGGKGAALPAGSRVEVTDVNSDSTAGTESAIDGSFAVALPGNPNDAYRVTVRTRAGAKSVELLPEVNGIAEAQSCAEVMSAAADEREQILMQRPACSSDDECIWVLWDQLAGQWAPSIYRGGREPDAVPDASRFSDLEGRVSQRTRELQCSQPGVLGDEILKPLGCVSGDCIMQSEAEACTWESYRALHRSSEYLDCGEYSAPLGRDADAASPEQASSDACIREAIANCRPAFQRKWSSGTDSGVTLVTAVVPSDADCELLLFSADTGLIELPYEATREHCRVDGSTRGLTDCVVDSQCSLIGSTVTKVDLHLPVGWSPADAGAMTDAGAFSE